MWKAAEGCRHHKQLWLEFHLVSHGKSITINLLRPRYKFDLNNFLLLCYTWHAVCANRISQILRTQPLTFEEKEDPADYCCSA